MKIEMKKLRIPIAIFAAINLFAPISYLIDPPCGCYGIALAFPYYNLIIGIIFSIIYFWSCKK